MPSELLGQVRTVPSEWLLLSCPPSLITKPMRVFPLQKNSLIICSEWTFALTAVFIVVEERG